MVHYVFWLFSGGAPASQLTGRGGGIRKPPSHPAAARRSSQRRHLFLWVSCCLWMCSLNFHRVGRETFVGKIMYVHWFFGPRKTCI